MTNRRLPSWVSLSSPLRYFVLASTPKFVNSPQRRLKLCKPGHKGFSDPCEASKDSDSAANNSFLTFAGMGCHSRMFPPKDAVKTHVSLNARLDFNINLSISSFSSSLSPTSPGAVLHASAPGAAPPRNLDPALAAESRSPPWLV